MRRGLAGGIALFIAFLCASASAQPRPPKAFVDAYQAGKDAYNLGEFDKARVALERAASIVPSAPGPHRYLAATAAGQKRWQSCLDHATDYIRLSEPASRYREDVSELHAQCRKELGRPRFVGALAEGAGALAVTSNVDGTSIRVNDLSYGATPLSPRALAPGDVTVSATAAGHLPDERRVTIYPGLVIDVEFRLVPDPDYQAAPTPVADSSPAEIPDVGWIDFRTPVSEFTVTADGAPVELDDKGRWKGQSGDHVVRIEAAGFEPWQRQVRVVKGQSRTVDVELVRAGARDAGQRNGWIAFGVAAAFTGAGIVFDAREASAREEAQDIFDIETARQAGTPTDALPFRTRQEMDDASDRARGNALLSGVAYGLAAVSLGVSVYFLVKNRGDERRGVAPTIAVVPVIDASGAGAAATGAAAVLRGDFDW